MRLLRTRLALLVGLVACLGVLVMCLLGSVRFGAALGKVFLDGSDLPSSLNTAILIVD